MIKISFDKVMYYLIESGYAGYDPYDGASSEYEWINGRKLTRLLSTYLNKFFPVNLRSILKIPVTRQNQALAFVGRALLYDYETYRSEISVITDHLIAESLFDKYGYHCWDAHGFPIQMRSGYRAIGKTDIIGDEAVGRFFLELFEIVPDQKYKDICIDICRSFAERLLSGYREFVFFRYTPETPEHRWCYNASAIGAAYITAVSHKFIEEVNRRSIEKALQDVISRQKPDGEWWYSLDLETGYEKQQIDFHQGFILDALLDYMQCTGIEEPYLDSYKKGLDFYFNKQFLPDGRGIYRYPKKYPVNIHNQAQGIVTFTRAAAAGFGDHYLDFAQTIAEWTIKNMQDPKGHFYYVKYPFFTNKIPYIRWSDAAMSFALAVYLRTRQAAKRNYRENFNIISK